MPEAVFDFADIRSRMLGEDKVKPMVRMVKCETCGDLGWIKTHDFAQRSYRYSDCPLCRNPEAKPCP